LVGWLVGWLVGSRLCEAGGVSWGRGGREKERPKGATGARERAMGAAIAGPAPPAAARNHPSPRNETHRLAPRLGASLSSESESESLELPEDESLSLDDELVLPEPEDEPSLEVSSVLAVRSSSSSSELAAAQKRDACCVEEGGVEGRAPKAWWRGAVRDRERQRRRTASARATEGERERRLSLLLLPSLCARARPGHRRRAPPKDLQHLGSDAPSWLGWGLARAGNRPEASRSSHAGESGGLGEREWRRTPSQKEGTAGVCVCSADLLARWLSGLLVCGRS
jgi:hypothetical protein